MAQKTQMVTIPLEEYRELLLKDKPLNGNDSMMIERVLNEISKEIEYSESTYSSNYVGDNLKICHADEVIKEIMRILKYTDLDRYMNIWNKAMSNHRKEEEAKARIEQMNQAKEIRKGSE